MRLIEWVFGLLAVGIAYAAGWLLRGPRREYIHVPPHEPDYEFNLCIDGPYLAIELTDANDPEFFRRASIPLADLKAALETIQ